MSGKKTKEYRWYFRQIMGKLISDGEIGLDELPSSPSFKVIMRIVNKYKQLNPNKFKELQSEFAGSISD